MSKLKRIRELTKQAENGTDVVGTSTVHVPMTQLEGIAKASGPSPKNNELFGKHRLKGRLPNGSQFVLEPYKAISDTVGSWTGTLRVPGCKPVKMSNSSLFKLLTRLDDEYRKNLVDKIEESVVQGTP